MALYPEGTAPLPLDDVQRAANKANELGRQALGQSGAVVLSGATSSGAGNFVAVQFINSTVVASITAPGITNAASLQTTIPAGTVIYGDIRSITLTSGLAVVYKVG
jgi:hypothetical protein